MESNKPDPETENKINQLSMLEQNLQNLGLQKQQFQNQNLEIESALSEIETSEESFKIIGNLMVKVGKEKIKNDLNDKKETIQLRIKTLEKQEEKFREKTKGLQDEILKNIKGNENRGEGK
ncbi:MAG TPA: prefoldin subunit beta [Candidatus Nanoarchaeia archaeon]|nr:prefoldin subunit beta [Candidatus Nanoarchaeia archaeon]